MLTRLQKSAAYHSTVNSVTSVTQPARDWLAARLVVRLLDRTIREMSADDATHMAAGVAYYSLFSLFPLLLFLIAAFGLVLDRQFIQLRVTDAFSGYFPGSSQLIGSSLEGALDVRGALGVFGILGLLWSGSAVFGAVSRAVNRAWDIHTDRPFFISKPRQLGMAAGVGLLFLGSMSVAWLAGATDRLITADVLQAALVLQILERGTLQLCSFALTAGMFLLVYKLMPNTRTYWRYVWPGAMVAAVLFELAKNLFVFYLLRFNDFHGKLLRLSRSFHAKTAGLLQFGHYQIFQAVIPFSFYHVGSNHGIKYVFLDPNSLKCQELNPRLQIMPHQQ